MSLESSASLWDGISFWLIGIGAALAFVGTIAAVRARKLGRELATEKTVIAAREKAVSDRAIANANARAAEANQIAEQERLARLRLEASLAPRNLDPDQQQVLSQKLKLFSGQQIDIVLFSTDPEVVRLSSEISVVLRLASWNETVWSAISGPGTVAGIVVSASSDADERNRTAARTLAAGLVEGHVGATFDPAPFDRTQMPVGGLMGPNWTKETASKVRLFIGKKS